MAFSPEQTAKLSAILYAAAASPWGVALLSNNPMKHRERLYAMKSHLGDPLLKNLQIRMSPIPGAQLVLVREDLVQDYGASKEKARLAAEAASELGESDFNLDSLLGD